MIDTVELKSIVVDALSESAELEDFIVQNLDTEKLYLFSGVDIDAAPEVYPMIVVRTPKVSNDNYEQNVAMIIDIQVEYETNPEQLIENTKRYGGDDIIEMMRDIVIDAIISRLERECGLSVRQWTWEQDLIMTYPVYSGFVVFDINKEITI